MKSIRVHEFGGPEVLKLEDVTKPIPGKGEVVVAAKATGLNIPYATAYRALFQKAKAQPGETVFIHGASGGVGTAAIQWCKIHGIRVIGTGGTEEGRRLARDQGADHVLDHRAPNYLEE